MDWEISCAVVLCLRSMAAWTSATLIPLFKRSVPLQVVPGVWLFSSLVSMFKICLCRGRERGCSHDAMMYDNMCESGMCIETQCFPWGIYRKDK